MPSSNRVLKLSLVCMALTTSSLAFASGFQSNRLSPSLQGTALAGAAAARNNASAMSINPATLATIKGNQISIGGSYNLSHFGYSNGYGEAMYDPGGIPNPNSKPIILPGVSEESNIQQGVIIPDAYAAFSLTPRWKVGLAVTQPWRVDNKYDDNWKGSILGTDFEVKSAEIAPTVAFQVNKVLSFGAALDVTYLQLREAGDIALSGEPIIGQQFQGSDWGVGATVGMLVTPLSGTNIGLSYHTSIDEALTGTLAIKNAGKYNGNYDGKVKVTLPSVVDFSVSQAITPKLTALFTTQWTHSSTMPDLKIDTSKSLPISALTIRNDWKNSWLFALGAKYQLNKKLTLRAGGAFDGSPVPSKTRTTSLPEGNSYTLALGAGYKLSKQLMFNLSYEHIFYQSTKVDMKQYTDGKSGWHPSYLIAKADYSGSANVFGAGVRWMW